MTLDQVIADARGQAAVLRTYGAGDVADALERLCEQVAEAAAPFLEYQNEQEAMLSSGRSQAWLRTRFPEWERRGLARMVRGRREYLKVVVPQDLNLDAVRADARRAAGESAA
jgi:hypothetical protein